MITYHALATATFHSADQDGPDQPFVIKRKTHFYNLYVD